MPWVQPAPMNGIQHSGRACCFSSGTFRSSSPLLLPKPMEIYLSVNDFPGSISQLPKRKEENIIYEVVCVKLFNILTRRSIFRSLTPFRDSAGFKSATEYTVSNIVPSAVMIHTDHAGSYSSKFRLRAQNRSGALGSFITRLIVILLTVQPASERDAKSDSFWHNCKNIKLSVLSINTFVFVYLFIFCLFCLLRWALRDCERALRLRKKKDIIRYSSTGSKRYTIINLALNVLTQTSPCTYSCL